MDMENKETGRSLIVLAPRKSSVIHADAGVIVQLLSIRDQHPQWCDFRREHGVIAAHKYAAQLKFSAPHKIIMSS